MATPVQQARALATTVGVRELPARRVLRLRGDEQRDWLNGQVTADVRHTRAGDGVYALVVNVKGRILADVWVVDDGSALHAILPASAFDSVRASFEQQIIMEDVELEELAGVCVLSVQGPLAREIAADEKQAFACDELGHGGAFVLVPDVERDAALARLTQRARARGGDAVDEQGFELARIRAGRPSFTLDFAERTYPQEAGLKGLAVAFNKGCYLGQEVVCTLENRGKLSRRLVRLEALHGNGTVGDELRAADGTVVGQLTSVVIDDEHERAIALGYAKLAHTSTGTELDTSGARWVVRALAGAD